MGRRRRISGEAVGIDAGGFVEEPVVTDAFYSKRFGARADILCGGWRFVGEPLARVRNPWYEKVVRRIRNRRSLICPALAGRWRFGRWRGGPPCGGTGSGRRRLAGRLLR